VFQGVWQEDGLQSVVMQSLAESFKVLQAFLLNLRVDHQAIKDGGDKGQVLSQLLQYFVESCCGGANFLVMLASRLLIQSLEPVVMGRF
jgi:hypothetical protein